MWLTSPLSSALEGKSAHVVIEVESFSEGLKATWEEPDVHELFAATTLPYLKYTVRA